MIVIINKVIIVSVLLSLEIVFWSGVNFVLVVDNIVVILLILVCILVEVIIVKLWL